MIVYFSEDYDCCEVFDEKAKENQDDVLIPLTFFGKIVFQDDRKYCEVLMIY